MRIGERQAWRGKGPPREFPKLAPGDGAALLVPEPAAPEQRDRVGERDERRAVGVRRADVLVVERPRDLRAAQRQLEERQVPREVAVQLRRLVVVGEPRPKEAGAFIAGIAFVADVRKAVGRVAVSGVEVERALDEAPAPFPLARLRAGEAVDVEKPPVFAVRHGQAFEQIQLDLVAVAAPAEADEAEDAGGQREHEAVTRELAQVLDHVGERARHVRLDIERDRLHVPALAARGGRRQLDGARRGGPRLGHGATELERPRVGRVGEREAWVGRDGPPERLLGAHVGGEQFLHGQHVLLAGDR